MFTLGTVLLGVFTVQKFSTWSPSVGGGENLGFGVPVAKQSPCNLMSAFLVAW